MHELDPEIGPELELELLRTELETLYQVSRILSRSLDLKETLSNVLRAPHDGVGLERGMVSLVEPETGGLQVSVAHGLADVFTEDIRYRPGEGVVGMIMAEAEPVALRRIADEPRFLGPLGIYERVATALPVMMTVDLAWAFAASWARGWLRSPRAIRMANRASATAMTGAAVAIDTR